MSILPSDQYNLDEAEQRALFDDMSDDEAFENLDAWGVDEIKWSKSLNNEYMNWIYLNIK
jgi:hypothetical protein